LPQTIAPSASLPIHTVDHTIPLSTISTTNHIPITSTSDTVHIPLPSNTVPDSLPSTVTIDDSSAVPNIITPAPYCSSRHAAAPSRDPLYDTHLTMTVSDIAASAAHYKADRGDHSAHAPALIAEFASIHDSHMLIPLTIDTVPLSIDEILHTISSSSTDLSLLNNNDLSWSEALASPE
jgi:hypothetical protein